MPVRDQARILGAFQDPLWSVGYRRGGREAVGQWQHPFSARSRLTAAPCLKAQGTEQGASAHRQACGQHTLAVESTGAVALTW